MKIAPFFLAISLSAVVYAGDKIGNGGDSIALEFTSLARGMAHLLQNKHCATDEFDIADLMLTIDSTQVRSKEKTILNDAEVDAINYPNEKKIMINRSRWKQLHGKSEIKAKLALHEYLGILGLDDSSYELSSKLENCLKSKKNLRASTVAGNKYVDIVDKSSLKPENIKVGLVTYPTSYFNFQSASASAGSGLITNSLGKTMTAGGSSGVTQNAPEVRPTKTYQLSISYLSNGSIISAWNQCIDLEQCLSLQNISREALKQGKSLIIDHNESALRSIRVFNNSDLKSAVPAFSLKDLKKGTIFKIKHDVVTGAYYNNPDFRSYFSSGCRFKSRKPTEVQIVAGSSFSLKGFYYCNSKLVNNCDVCKHSNPMWIVTNGCHSDDIQNSDGDTYFDYLSLFIELESRVIESIECGLPINSVRDLKGTLVDRTSKLPVFEDIYLNPEQVHSEQN